MFSQIFRKNAPLGVPDADDETAILDAVVEMTQASAAVAAVETQPEPEPAPIPVDYSETHHMQADLQELRDMGLAFQARLHRLSEKYYRIGVRTEPGKLVLAAAPSNGSPAVAPPDLAFGLRVFLEDCCREKPALWDYSPPPPKIPTPSEEAEATRRRYIEMKLGIPYEQVAGLSPEELAERLSRVEVPVPRMASERWAR